MAGLCHYHLQKRRTGTHSETVRYTGCSHKFLIEGFRVSGGCRSWCYDSEWGLGLGPQRSAGGISPAWESDGFVSQTLKT